MILTFFVETKCHNADCPNDIVSVVRAVDIKDYEVICMTTEDGEVFDDCPKCKSPLISTGDIVTFKKGKKEKKFSYVEYKDGWIINFRQCIQDSQIHGTDNEHMNARVFFGIKPVAESEEIYKDLSCNIRQPHGENFSFQDSPIEVDIPEELKGYVNYSEFRDEFEKYYKSLVGRYGKLINIPDRIKNTTMKDNDMTDWDYTVIHAGGGPTAGAW